MDEGASVSSNRREAILGPPILRYTGGMDKLIIDSLELYAAVGVTAAERQVGQWLCISAELACDLSAAGQSDQLGDTISYATVAQRLHAVATERPFLLLEALAEAMAQRLLAEFPIAELRLRVVKRPPPLPLKLASIGVEIVRRPTQGEAR